MGSLLVLAQQNDKFDAMLVSQDIEIEFEKQ
jgi:hypothetical protein